MAPIQFPIMSPGTGAPNSSQRESDTFKWWPLFAYGLHKQALRCFLAERPIVEEAPDFITGSVPPWRSATEARHLNLG